MEILWLGEEAAHDAAVVGGKAASLSRLAAAHRVPPGFVLTTRALGGSLPADLEAALGDPYRALGEPRVAVRSSGADEDGAEASFAGQFETYLNLSGVGEVAEAVARCCESARSERALAYRRAQGLAEDVRIAVLVQQLVSADVSAVAFSANPVTGSRDEVVINAAWGLGESVVGGTVTPDTIVVRKQGPAVSSHVVADKRRMTVPVPGGTREVDVPALLRNRPALADEQALEIAGLALALESTSGHPVDVECALCGGALYLLQCRPITTLAGRSPA